MATEKTQGIIDAIKGLTILELADLVKEIEAEFGVSAAPAAAEKTEFDVVLKAAGASKLQVIKVVREITGLGLKDAKDLVDGAPKTIKEGLSKADAEAMQKQLTDVGAEVELK